MKDSLIEMKNNLQGNNSRMDEAKDQINNLEYEKEKTTQSEHQEKQRIQKNEDCVRSLQDNFKCNNIHITGAPEEKEQEIEHLSEKNNDRKLPQPGKEIDIQVQEAESPNKMNPKKHTPRHTIIKMPKVKDKENLKHQEKSSQLPARELP